MKRVAVVLIVAAAAVAGAAWFLREPAAFAPTQAPAREVAHAAIAAAPAPADSPASRKLDEVRAMSETVRNSTFVIAIRTAGYVCEDVIGVDQAEAGAPAWRARCPDLRAYLLSVGDDGGLGVEPTVDHWDSVVPPFMPVPRGNPPDLLEPREPRR